MERIILICILLVAGCAKPRPNLTGDGTGANASGENPGRQVFQVKGVVQEIKTAENKAIIRHEEIPNYMPAMTMPFDVRKTNELAGLSPGDEVTFSMIVTEDDGWIENVKRTGVTTNLPPKQRQATRIVRDVEPLDVGDKMPNYTFTNSFGKSVSFSDFPGQALAFTFIFTRCPFPTFCPRMNSNFAEAHNLLKADSSAPTNWHLFSISFDPDYDTPERLLRYSSVYNPDPKKWDWVTGAMIEIDAITEQVGLAYAAEAGTINHNLRTVVLNPDRTIRTILIGNEWTPEELAMHVREAAAQLPPSPKN